MSNDILVITDIIVMNSNDIPDFIMGNTINRIHELTFFL